jgi:excisionase family DNA binding protein
MMSGLLERSETAVPSEQDTELAASASRALARATRESLTVRLEDGQELVLPQMATRLLAELLTEMSQGNAVTIIPIHAELTTQQAADFLNVSRPYLVGLLKDQKIPFHTVGTHRRVRFADLCDYRATFDQQRQAAMEALARQAQEEGLGY